MSGFRDALRRTVASAGKRAITIFPEGGLASPGITAFTRTIMKRSLLSALLISICANVHATVNVVLSTSAPQSLQNEFLLATTQQFNSKLVKSPFFANTYTLTLIDKSNYQPPGVSSALITLDTISNKLVKISSDTFVYGFYYGALWSRNVDLGIISNYITNCSSRTYFTGTSTSPWSPASCNIALGNASMTIYQMNLSTPTVIPPPGALP